MHEVLLELICESTCLLFSEAFRLFSGKRSMSSSVSIGGLESLRNSSKSSGFGFWRFVTAAAIESAQCVGGALILGCSRVYCGMIRCCCSFSMISNSIRVGVLFEFVSGLRNRVGGACRMVGSGGCRSDVNSGYEIRGCCRSDSSLSDCRTCDTCRCISVSCCRVLWKLS